MTQEVRNALHVMLDLNPEVTTTGSMGLNHGEASGYLYAAAKFDERTPAVIRNMSHSEALSAIREFCGIQTEGEIHIKFDRCVSFDYMRER